MCRDEILSEGLAIGKHHTEVELRLSISLVRREFKPLHRLRSTCYPRSLLHTTAAPQQAVIQRAFRADRLLFKVEQTLRRGPPNIAFVPLLSITDCGAIASRCK